MDFDSLDLNVGDSVVVRPGILCPDDHKLIIAGWQGRVEEIDVGEDGELLVLVEWDSFTIKEMPEDFIEESIQEGLDYAVMYLEYGDVIKTEPRDSVDDVRKVHEEIDQRYSWDTDDEADHEEIDQKESIIEKVLYDYEDTDPLKSWKKFLKKSLRFPFDAIVFEATEKTPQIKKGESLKVLKITDIDEYNGIMVMAEKDSDSFEFPLCNLEIIQENTANFLPFQAYCYWFVNR